MTQAHFPFTAVYGQDQFKLALILAAIHPAIGGVVISGPRGSAKSTLARGMVDLLSVDDQTQEPAPFVTLPLGASEEMLVGTLDLNQVLNDKQVAFHPGLLAKAHGGVLYVDEVNLLPDPLVDQLLDVSASGVNRVERDGISHSHAAEFVLVGTMNPDEGELRSQLLDRFGLWVELDTQLTPQARVEIVKRREQFDHNPKAFTDQYEAEKNALMARIQAAKAHLREVACDDALRLEIATRCAEAHVDGLRADIVWFRAALAHAAFQGKAAITQDDIDAVEALVLAHRRKQPPTPPQHNSPPSPPPNSGFKRPEESKPQSEGQWGAMTPKRQTSAEKTAVNLPEDALQEALKPSSAQPIKGRATSKKPDWFKTLIGTLPDWPPKALAFKQQGRKPTHLHLVLLDTSASVLKEQGFAYAKAAVLKICEKAYVRREQVAVFGFGNSEVTPLLPRVRAPKALRHWLDEITAGGGTPMQAAFNEAQRYLRQLKKQQPDLQVTAYVLSDGRSSSSLAGIELEANLVWIDTELSPVKRGKGPRLAAELNATYLSLAGA
jgi:magnesium chelatase subunit D